MEEKEINISDKCYALAVRALCKGGYLKEVPESWSDFQIRIEWQLEELIEYLLNFKSQWYSFYLSER